MKNSLFVTLGMILAVAVVAVTGQTVFSPATVFPSVAIQTSGSAGAPSLRWTASTTTGLYYASSGVVGLAGSLLPGADATYDLGSMSRQFRNLYLSTALAVPGIQVGNGTAGAPSFAFASEGSLGFYRFASGTIGGTGHLTPSVDNTYDFGTSSTRRWRYGWFGTGIYTGVETFGFHATATNNVLLRSAYAASSGSFGAGMLGITDGSQATFGDLQLNRISAGNAGGEPTFDDGFGLFYWDFRQAPTTVPVSAHYLSAFDVRVSPSYSATMTASGWTLYGELNLSGTHNYTGDNYAGVYGDVYAYTTGTVTDMSGVLGEVDAGGTGAIANLFAFKGACCSFDPAMGIASTVTRSGFFRATQPYTSAVPPVTHTAIWVEDQTAGGTFVPSVANYILKLDAPSSKNTLMTAVGLLGLYGATPTATAPLKVGGTMTSTRVDDGNSGTTLTIDLSTGNVHKVTLTGNVTFTLTNPADAAEYYVEIFTGAGSFTATWPAAVKWPSATAPTITTAASRMDLIRLVYDSTSGDYWGTFNQVYTP